MDEGMMIMITETCYLHNNNNGFVEREREEEKNGVVRVVVGVFYSLSIRGPSFKMIYSALTIRDQQNIFTEAFSAHKTHEILEKLKVVQCDIVNLSTELCYHVELAEGCEYLNINQIKILQWLLSSPLQPHSLRNESAIKFNFSTADSSNSVQICESVGLHDVVRLEVSTRYLITFKTAKTVDDVLLEKLAAPLHDRMTQCIYTKENLPRHSFNEGLPKDLEPWYVVPLQKEGMGAMKRVNQKLGLAFDSWDMEFYMDLFVNKLKRDPTSVELFDLAQKTVESDIIFTAETHNMPTAVAPFSGATTGTGGRIRDVQGVGRGGHPVAGTVGYSVGNIQIPGYDLPWEDKSWKYPNNFASPLQILIEASNGASDYGNKFGEPVVSGFVQSYGLKNGDNVREEFVKPIMFSAGIGYMPHTMIKKNKPEKGDAEMGNRLNRVIRACLEADVNPVESIHDQGAGGNGNVLKELVEPEGAVVFTKEFQLGDPTITTLELWGAEYQENDALLCPVSFVGEVTGDGYVSLVEDSYQDKYIERSNRIRSDVKSKLPYDLHLEAVLGNMPRKTFDLKTEQRTKVPLTLPSDITVEEALNRVLRLVDRCVTGLVAQQQCVGPLQSPLADCAVLGLSYSELVGSATAIGTQNIKGLLEPAAGARLSLGEALTNLVFAGITQLEDVKCSGNWMWPGKTGAAGAALVVACRALAAAMAVVGVAVDGGKDSLSMCADVGGDTGTCTVYTAGGRGCGRRQGLAVHVCGRGRGHGYVYSVYSGRAWPWTAARTRCPCVRTWAGTRVRVQCIQRAGVAVDGGKDSLSMCADVGGDTGTCTVYTAGGRGRGRRQGLAVHVCGRGRGHGYVYSVYSGRAWPWTAARTRCPCVRTWAGTRVRVQCIQRAGVAVDGGKDSLSMCADVGGDTACTFDFLRVSLIRTMENQGRLLLLEDIKFLCVYLSIKICNTE
ncbi:unnamed protein product [Leptidea sinapis]|uniref:PurM-like C-terminal domain-containing protein n=1 Tax=Leptidea sinapis TaxID=189913 RepID=A0A5E4QL06_9NEOP|nr:unnamed protein product [Leptidea sinapis]